MRDFRDAKAMAQTLRAALAARGHKITVADSLELSAQSFGVKDWNTLAALIRSDSNPPRKVAVSRGQEMPGRRQPLVDLSEQADRVFPRAVEIAKQRGHWGRFSAEHFLLSLTEDPDAIDMMQACGADVALVKMDVDRHLDGLPSRTLDETPPGETSWNGGFVHLPALAMAAMGGRSEATGADILDSVRQGGGPSARILHARGFDSMRAHNYWTAQALEPRLPVALDDVHSWAALMYGNYNYDRDLKQSDRLRQSLRASIEHTHRLRHTAVTPMHLLLALVDDPDAAGLMRACGVDPEKVRRDSVKGLASIPEGQTGRSDPWLYAKIKSAFERAKDMGHRRLNGAHVLLSLLSAPDDPAGKTLLDRGMIYQQALVQVERTGNDDD